MMEFQKESALGRKWRLHAYDDQQVQKLQNTLGDEDDFRAKFLSRQNIRAEDVAKYLTPTLREQFPDPFSLLGMKVATDRVGEAILNNEKIAVFADYDVDGATSSALLVRYFRELGIEIGLYVPERAEGFGPTSDAFEKLKNEETELVITVDCGAAAQQAILVANKLAMSVVVLDHHPINTADSPECDALVNPNQSEDTSDCGYLCGAGVTFVFLAGLNNLLKTDERFAKFTPPELLQWLDLCALGTVCDMVPLVGANRAIVKQGLKVLARKNNPGLAAMMDVVRAGTDFDEGLLGFTLGPRLNAGSRLGYSRLASELLITNDQSDAKDIATQLHDLNKQRKDRQTQIIDEANTQAKQMKLEHPDRPVLLLHKDDWGSGVLGIVAGQMVNMHNRAVIVVSTSGLQQEFVSGSGRSIEGLNLGGLFAEAQKIGLAEKGGGHAMAGGIKLKREKVEEFNEWINEKAGPCFEQMKKAKETQIDFMVLGGTVDGEFCERIKTLGPFGQGVEQPVFVTSPVMISYYQIMSDVHLKVICEDEAGRYEGIAFRHAESELGHMLKSVANSESKVRLVGKFDRSVWNGRVRVQLLINDGMEVK